MLLDCIGKLLANIVEHTLNFYRSLEDNNTASYEQSTKQEIDSEVYPNWPIKFFRPVYHKTCKDEDTKAWDKLCRKNFKDHKSLSPGLFIVTCACPRKAIL